MGRAVVMRDKSVASETMTKRVGASASAAKAGVNEMVEAAPVSAPEVGGQVKTGIDRASGAAADLLSKGTDMAQDAVDELPAHLSDVGAAGERLVRQGRRSLHRGVRKQPVEALLLAGAIGYLVGWATSRG